MNYSSEQDFLAFEKCNIIVSGIPLGESLEIFQREVHRRGFLIDSWLEEKQMTTCLPDDATESTLQNSFKPTVNGSKATIMLKISHDLQSKISLHLNISRNEDRNSSAQALARLDTTGNQSKKKSGSNTIYANEAIRILDRLIKSNVLHLDASAIKNVIIWLAHDSSFEFTSSTVSKSTSTVLTKQITSYYSLDKVAEYYGPYIGIYFGFLRCYTEWLIFPSILGLLLFGHQMYIGSVESAFLPLYGIIISIWSTLFVEFWRIRNAELNYEWNAHERLRFEDEADRRNNVSTSIGHKLNRQNESSTKVTRTLRIASTCIILLALIFLIFYATWHLKRWKTDVEAEYANIYSLYRYLPVFCYSASAPIIGIVIHPVAKSLTMFERHQSSKDYQHNFILKKFALEFATRNSLLLYIAFWMQDLQQLRSTLISLLVTSAIVNNFSEVGVPFAKSLFKKQTSKSQDAPVVTIAFPSISSSILQRRQTLKSESRSRNRNFSPISAKSISSPMVSPSTSSPIVSPVSPPKLLRDTSSSKLFPKKLSLNMATSAISKFKSILGSPRSASTTNLNLNPTDFAVQSLSPESSRKTFFRRKLKLAANLVAESKASLNPEKKEKLKEMLLNELSLNENFDMEEDYLELIIQYGYSTMFAVAFPLSPLLSYINNYFEFGVDLQKLSFFKRTVKTDRITIGAWYQCLEFINFVAIIMNCYLLCIVCSQSKNIIPLRWQPMLESQKYRLIALVVLEHLLFLVRSVIVMLIGNDPSKWSEKNGIDIYEKARALAMERLKLFMFEHNWSFSSKIPLMSSPSFNSDSFDNKSRSTSGHSATANRSRRISQISHVKESKEFNVVNIDSIDRSQDTDNGEEDSSYRDDERDEEIIDNFEIAFAEIMKDVKALSDSSTTTSVNQATIDQELALLQLERDLPTQFEFNPWTVFLITVIPAVLQFLNISLWFYLPLALAAFSFMQWRNDSITTDDGKADIRFIPDPELIQQIRREMPSWFADSDFQLVEWCNDIVQTLWPQIAVYGQKIGLKMILKEIGVAPVSVDFLSMGTVPPKVVGVRFHETVESVVRVDVDVRWVGNPKMVLKAGISPFLTSIEVSDCQLSTLVTLEMLHFVPKIPFFTTGTVSCLKKPSVDFSIKVGSIPFNLMYLGPSGYSINALVKYVMIKIMKKMVMYPRKMNIAIITPEKISGESGEAAVNINFSTKHLPQPIGLLAFTIESASNLIKGDMFSSDPFVYITSESGEQNTRTTVKQKTLNPVWDEHIDIIVFNTTDQRIQITVKDSDGNHIDGDFLGCLDYSVSKLILNGPSVTAIEEHLSKVKRGKLKFSYSYHKLANKSAAKEVVDNDSDDILYSMRSGALKIDPGIDTVGNSRSTVHVRGVILISLIRCRNIRPRSSFTGIYSIKTAVTFSMSGIEKTTEHIKGFSDPTYEEEFAIPVRDPDVATLTIQVKDISQKASVSRLLGELNMSLSGIDMQTSYWEKEHPLQGFGENLDSYVTFRIKWMGAQ